ncbi:unnamed protein product [Parnassius mnemosyne]|uniref:Uncharacterized protein n=1 Tax=Parnassius mnemosyne TaxID=213953 RepID=A0AAV1L729_9NEOP
MNQLTRARDVLFVLLSLLYLKECAKDVFHNVDEKYHLVTEAYSVTKNLFIQGRDSYEMLKNRSLHVMDTFLDLVTIVNEEMAKELRSAIVKFYKIKYFHDFTHYVISMEEVSTIGVGFRPSYVPTCDFWI